MGDPERQVPVVSCEGEGIWNGENTQEPRVLVEHGAQVLSHISVGCCLPACLAVGRCPCKPRMGRGSPCSSCCVLLGTPAVPRGTVGKRVVRTQTPATTRFAVN